MNKQKEIIKKIEGVFEGHEVWTRAEIKQVLNQMWLDVDKEDESLVKICHTTKKELEDDQCYMHTEQNTLFCYCHDQPLEDPK